MNAKMGCNGKDIYTCGYMNRKCGLEKSERLQGKWGGGGGDKQKLKAIME